jgi:hypothetical protein
MELSDRYFKAVKFWLPNEQKQDIIAELSEDIHSQIEEKESALGRKLTDTEVEAILKRSGPPMLVAGRYLPKRYLIGPALFPVYWFILKLNWMCVFGPWLVLVVGLGIFAPAGGSGHFQGMWEVFSQAALINFAAITGVFALIERYHAKGWVTDWNPRKQLAVRDSNRVPRSSSISELAWYAMLLLWWVNVLRIPAIPSIEIKISPAISRFLFWPILALLFCQAAIACVNAFRPQWSPRRAAIRGIVDGLSLIVVLYLLTIWIQGGTFVTVTSAKLSPVEIADAQRWTTFGWSVMLLIWAAASYAARVFQDARRATRKPPIRNWAFGLLVGE